MINKNHMEMCRFVNQDDDGYEKFVVALKGYVRAIESAQQLAEEGRLASEMQRATLLERRTLEEEISRREGP